MSMRRQAVLWSVLTPLVLIAAVVAFVLLFDWNRLKPWLNDKVSDAIGRPFAVNGDLILTWRRPEGESGWGRLVPWPRLSARDVTIGNPDWTQQPNLATARELVFLLRPLPLLTREISLPSITIDGPSVALERLADKRDNWTFPTREDKEPSQWHLEIGEVVLTRGHLALNDAASKIELRATLETIGDAALYDKDRDGPLAPSSAPAASAAPAGGASVPAAASASAPAASAAAAADAKNSKGEPVYGIRWRAVGHYNKATINANGKAGAVLNLRDASRPYPLQADVRVGSTRAQIEGTLTEPARLAALDLMLQLSGESMADLYSLTGVVLPETPPYRTNGRLTATLRKGASVYRYQNFTGRVGGSDLAGTLTYSQRDPRPLLAGELVSKQLRFEDLAPLIGADAKPGQPAARSPVRQPADKALPVAPFRTERWDDIDADVRFTGQRIIRDVDLPINNLETHIQLQDGVLNLKPLNFGVAGGTLASNLQLNGKRTPMGATIDMTARRLKLKQLFPNLESMRASVGEINGAAKLSATGNSVAALLGSSNGEARLLVENGTISKFILEAMGLNVGSVIIAKLFGDKPVQIHCGVADFTFTNGMGRARTFVIDTEDATINATGVVDLASERLGLTINPDSKGMRVFSLRSPLYVGGTLKDPRVSPDIGVLALRAGGAVALALLAPVATVLPLIDLSPAEDSQCAKLLAELRKRPTAPPPGKTYRDRRAPAASGPAAQQPAGGNEPEPRRQNPTAPAAPSPGPNRSPMYQGG
ncbi:AsmA family protein [Cupriavidus gilardii]|uniref:AsmA family protein n=1 Tax=Cupriavidus gilardii TaxID=82541 RepID=UPI001EE54A6C|nr:AsmA family protein [Cupriavidus gilardii]MCG5260242.1 AsmA family protein [Cupriavidus gilardii]MDF9432369.1 AsmA family protein [Cupriavidus gilardii]